jgi:hypothetical protein
VLKWADTEKLSTQPMCPKMVSLWIYAKSWYATDVS